MSDPAPDTVSTNLPLRLSSPVTNIPRVGPVKAQYLRKLGITYARDFLFTFPRRHDDFSSITPINKLTAGAKMTIRAKVKTIKTSYGWQGRRRLLRIFVDLEDDTGVINITWYNLRFLPRQLWRGRELLVAGMVEANPLFLQQKHSPDPSQPPLAVSLQRSIPKESPRERRGIKEENVAAKGNNGLYHQVSDNEKSSRMLSHTTPEKIITRFRMRSPVIEFITANAPTHTGRITPVYPETYGVTSRFLRYQVKNLLPLLRHIPEYLPPEIIKRHHFIGIQAAIAQVHFPDSTEQLEQAWRRLRFDELFFLQLAALVRRRQRRLQAATPITTAPAAVNTFIAKKLPFSLTAAQQRVTREILGDMKQSTPMNRLLQGDVGSGKSAVALIATYAAMQDQQKVLYLAPTEILARQQFNNFRPILRHPNTYLLIGATKTPDKKAIKQSLTKRQPALVIGTHALLQDDLNVMNLGLVIIDEQHRFGVKQRQLLLRQAAPTIPHLLTMTATPIPRTLSLTVYGDLDLSLLDELPPGRQPITTTIITAAQKDQAITFMLEQLHQGRQAYVIAPLVEQSDRLQVKSAQETVHEMRAYFPGIAIELIHGRLKPPEKQAIMNNFNAGAIQLLVSTAVVEVGVDIPNATCMIIEGAERFGLAQLHQFRGRIGRGEHQSYCYLFPSRDEAASNERLTALVNTTDGFKIAEADLRLRGPGEAYGVSQSGFNNLQVASLLDFQTIKLARGEAEKLLRADPDLTNHPILQRKVAQKNAIAHFE